MSAFPEGAIVYLKSGSPELVVEDHVADPDLVAVAWFDGGEVMRDTFHKDALTDVKPAWEP